MPNEQQKSSLLIMRRGLQQWKVKTPNIRSPDYSGLWAKGPSFCLLAMLLLFLRLIVLCGDVPWNLVVKASCRPLIKSDAELGASKMNETFVSKFRY